MSRQLVAGELVAGTYRHDAFSPGVTLTVGDGWTATLLDGFFDVQLHAGTPEVIAVQVARVVGVVGADSTSIVPSSARAAAESVAANASLTAGPPSASQVAGLPAHVVEVRNDGDAFAGIVDIPPGRLGSIPAAPCGSRSSTPPPRACSP